MKKNLKKIIIIIVSIIVFFVIITLVLDKIDRKNDNGTSFYYNGNLYNIKPKKIYIKVERYDVIQCITDPCPPIRSKVFIKIYTNERKELINEIKSQKEIPLESLSKEDLDTLLVLINEK